MKQYKILYEPKGKAGEYGELAANLINGCSFGCEYCYASRTLHMTKEKFHDPIEPRKDIINKLKSDFDKMIAEGDKREVFLCFTCDPLQPLAFENNLIDDVLIALESREIPYKILTKGGYLEMCNIAKWISPELCTIGSTLVFANDDDSKKHEPHAPVTSDRIKLLKMAKAIGCKTWVSLEPTWSKEDVMRIIAKTYKFVDEYKIGKLNYHPHAKEIDWKEFTLSIIDYCKMMDVKYTLKEDLKKLL